MRIYGLMVVKDERDVIEETLLAAVTWCDQIYVFDNGSTDGTWEAILALASQQPSILPFKQQAGPFSQALRGEIFRHYRDLARDGDWWCILDSDEFYIDDPREFLANVPRGYGEVWSSSYQYYLTERDLERYEAAPGAFLGQPIQERLRYYANNWSESRFIRHHAGLVWREDRDGKPQGKRPVGILRRYPHRIRLKHYQYRSPEQIERRAQARAGAVGAYRHEQRSDWLVHLFGEAAVAALPDASRFSERLVPSALLHFDTDDGHYVANEESLPPIPADRFRLRLTYQQLASLAWRVRRQIVRNVLHLRGETESLPRKV